MVGTMGIIFLIVPETPWWLLANGKRDKAARIMHKFDNKSKPTNIERRLVCSDLSDLLMQPH